MTNHHATTFADPDLSVPGHTALIVFVQETRDEGLHCEQCGYLGGFKPGRWREKHEREAWQRHIDAAPAKSSTGEEHHA